MHNMYEGRLRICERIAYKCIMHYKTYQLKLAAISYAYIQESKCTYVVNVQCKWKVSTSPTLQSVNPFNVKLSQY